jgi:hypothetical protein
MTHCCSARPPPRSRPIAGSARLNYRPIKEGDERGKDRHHHHPALTAGRPDAHRAFFPTSIHTLWPAGTISIVL